MRRDDKECYLDSGNHNSWVLISKVDKSVSVEAAEWAWFGVDGRLFFINRLHVFFLSELMNEKDILMGEEEKLLKFNWENFCE